ncbi:sensor histidine kinase [Nonomuraea rhizosphaerae]|uniref:sensor histidine kinase n=1 Tax=Nonomuraea rhizosphaerae TaxID=2665663 RepID=UPI001C5E72A9|nr:histidine kinase [Nonomuraea rhizosphaerae]
MASFLRRPAVRVALYVLLVAYLASGPVNLAVHQPSLGQALLVLPIGVIAFGACLWVTLHKTTPARDALLLVLALVGGIAMHLIEPYTGAAFFFMVIFVAPYRLGLRQAIVLTTIDITVFPCVSLWWGLEPSAALGMTAGLAYSAIFTYGIWHFYLTRQQSAEVAAAQAREAVLSERTRLAREVHDVLAHSQSAQILHLEGARMLLKEGGDPALVLDRVERAVRLARAGLEETRRALDALRGDELPLMERLERLAAEFRVTTGATCVLSIEADLDKLEAEARLAVVRTAQEALTNVRKHAPGASVSVTLHHVGKWCELEVRDDGKVTGTPVQGAGGGTGYGLVGMRERAELIGGSLTTCAEEDGFTVILKVPA